MMLFNNKPIDNKEYSEDILNEGLSIYEVCRVFRGKVIFLNDILNTYFELPRRESSNMSIR